MESGKYYLIGDGNNFYEGMTKEQILAAITQAVETHEISDVDTGFVTTLKEGNKSNGLKMWVGSTAEYNAIQTKEQNCLYILSDDTELEDLETEIARLANVINPIYDVLTRKDAVLYFSEEGGQIPWGSLSPSVALESPSIAEYDLVRVGVIDENNVVSYAVCSVVKMNQGTPETDYYKVSGAGFAPQTISSGTVGNPRLVNVDLEVVVVKETGASSVTENASTIMSGIEQAAPDADKIDEWQLEQVNIVSIMGLY